METVLAWRIIFTDFHQPVGGGTGNSQQVKHQLLQYIITYTVYNDIQVKGGKTSIELLRSLECKMLSIRLCLVIFAVTENAISIHFKYKLYTSFSNLSSAIYNQFNFNFDIIYIIAA